MSDPTTRLNAALEGRYHVERELGEGGMATVYLADDLKHERKVALKVLKPELAAVVGAERFLAEIKTTANLQHPHILPLFDSGEADSFLFYVMPYVEGETLRDRIDRDKQLPVDEAVTIAKAVANALETAHDQGIVHRDIKPANILLSRGEPLVADFGIALAVGAAGGGRLTETGLSIGTPYYMSPEQATGDQAVGPSSDTFALACVLYEMLVGEPPYPGTTAQAVLGKIIQGAPVSATAIRKSIPTNVDAAIRKALEKLPADRFTGASDFAKALADPGFRHGVEATPAVGAVAAPWKWTSLALAATTVGLALGLMSSLTRPEAVRPVERFAMPFSAGDEPTYLGNAGYDLSPDGAMLVYRHNTAEGQILMVRRWDELSATPVRDTEGAGNPAVSPDGLELAFDQGGEIKVLALAGGPVRTLTTGVTPEWGPDGFVYASTDSGAVRIPATGGAVEYISRLAEGELYHGVYDILPDGNGALIFAFSEDNAYQIRGVDLSNGEIKTIVNGLAPRYLPSGHLVYATDNGTMMASLFDPEKMELVGTPVAVMDGLQYYSLADDGKLFYSTGAVTGGVVDRVIQLLWVTRDGEAAPIDPDWSFVQGGADIGWRVSPDGTMLALRERTADGNDIWIKQLDAGPRSRLTFGEAEERMPVWGPGIGDVTFISARDGNMDVWSKPADGTGEAELVFDFERAIATVEWSPDREWIVIRTSGPRSVEGNRDIYGFRPGIDSTVVPLLTAPGYDEMYPSISPDGRFIAYQTTETDRHEIYVRPFPDVGSGRWQVSVDGGRNPRWAHNGRELFFQGPERQMMVVDADTESGFRAGTPEVLFEADPDWISGDISGLQYALAPDDERFVIARVGRQAEQEATEASVVLVNNFFEELRRLVPN